MYILSLERDRESNQINELIVNKQQEQIYDLEDFLISKDSIITLQGEIINEDKKINLHLNSDVEKYRKQANNWPYWLGGGLVGGFITGMLTWAILTK